MRAIAHTLTMQWKSYSLSRLSLQGMLERELSAYRQSNPLDKPAAASASALRIHCSEDDEMARVLRMCIDRDPNAPPVETDSAEGKKDKMEIGRRALICIARQFWRWWRLRSAPVRNTTRRAARRWPRSIRPANTLRVLSRRKVRIEFESKLNCIL